MHLWAQTLDLIKKAQNRCSRHDKKENKISLIYKEIHMGSVAKSYMTDGLLLI
jgi:hypothetical protein